MAVDVLVGLQWGDEGKGKIVDFLAKHYDIICRFQGGPNAGHTIYTDKGKSVLHTIPSGVFRPGVINIIGSGVVIDPITLKNEIVELSNLGIDVKDRLLISKKAHLILPSHRYLDAASENAKGAAKIGSTLRGIGPTYMDKTGRNGLRFGDILSSDFKKKYQNLKSKHQQIASIYDPVDFEWNDDLWFESIEYLRSFEMVDCEYYLDEALLNGKHVLAEGAQGSMLDVDFGTYPFVTSSNTVTAGVCIGLGISPQKIDQVIGISKAYCTRVGGGPFPTEISGEVGERLQQLGGEFGATTGRPRRCGWLDLVQLRYSVIINGVTQLVLTKSDVMDHFEEIHLADTYMVDGVETSKLPYDLCESNYQPNLRKFTGWNTKISAIDQSFEKMPKAFTEYIDFIEKSIGVAIKYVSVGPKREELIEMF